MLKNWLIHWKRTAEHPEEAVQYLSVTGMEGSFHILTLMCKFAINNLISCHKVTKQLLF